MTRALRILRIERKVTDLRRAAAFYTAALGFETRAAQHSDAEICLQRGEQTLVLQEGGVVEQVSACDQAFQHIALPVPDMDAAFAHLRSFAPRLISEGRPVRLPPESGGVIALKFRDPDGHPVEFLQFPNGRSGGIDHSAIVVADVARSIAFYRDTLGLRVTARQTNTGAEQDRLDGLSGVAVDVVALAPGDEPPHVELLGYRSPAVRPRDFRASWITRFVFEGEAGGAGEVTEDPDGHAVALLSPS